MSDKKQDEKKLEIRLDEETAQGVYVNLAVINHTDSEFVIDFAFAQPQAPTANVRSRVITSPRHFKRLIAALQDNLQRYERLHGQVEIAATQLPEDDHYH